MRSRLENLLQASACEVLIFEPGLELELAPDEPHGYVNRGNQYAQLGKIQEALADYTQAIELDPETAAAYYGRAFAHKAAGEVDPDHRSAAIADLERFLELNENPQWVEPAEQMLQELEGAGN